MLDRILHPQMNGNRLMGTVAPPKPLSRNDFRKKLCFGSIFFYILYKLHVLLLLLFTIISDYLHCSNLPCFSGQSSISMISSCHWGKFAICRTCIPFHWTMYLAGMWISWLSYHRYLLLAYTDRTCYSLSDLVWMRLGKRTLLDRDSFLGMMNFRPMVVYWLLSSVLLLFRLFLRL